jgi:hypothetical protein
MSLTGKSSDTLAITVTNDGFWPDLKVGDLLEQYRIPAEYQTNLIINELTMAMVNVNEPLTAVKQQVVEVLLNASLDDYCSTEFDAAINDEFILVRHYKRAVFCYAKAKLLQQFLTINRRKIAENEAKESDETEQFWLDESQSSISALFAHFLPDGTPASSYGAHIALL